MANRTELGPQAGAVVMATGIVSVAVHDIGAEELSLALLALASLLWVLLALAFLERVWRTPGCWRDEAGRPAALTAVAGTAVLGARATVLGWSVPGAALLALAGSLCAGLLIRVARSRPLPPSGSSFLITVALQSLVVLAAMLAGRERIAWLAIASLVLVPAATGAYVAVLIKPFELRELRQGAGDHWVAGGALAITTLACSELAGAAAKLPVLHGLHEPLKVIALVSWGVTMLWLAPLILAELRWPRPGYDVRRWATVFPLGMYAAMSSSLGAVAKLKWMAEFGHAWTWVALAAWTLTAAAAVRAVVIA